MTAIAFCVTFAIGVVLGAGGALALLVGRTVGEARRGGRMPR